MQYLEKMAHGWYMGKVLTYVTDLSGRAFTPQHSCSCLCKRGCGTALVHEGL